MPFATATERRHSLRSQRAKPDARCSRQSGRTSFGREPHAEQRRRQRSAGTVVAAGSADTSTAARRPQSQVAKIERTPRLRMLARSIAGPSNRRGMRRRLNPRACRVQLASTSRSASYVREYGRLRASFPNIGRRRGESSRRRCIRSWPRVALSSMLLFPKAFLPFQTALCR